VGGGCQGGKPWPYLFAQGKKAPGVMAGSVLRAGEQGEYWRQSGPEKNAAGSVSGGQGAGGSRPRPVRLEMGNWVFMQAAYLCFCHFFAPLSFPTSTYLGRVRCRRFQVDGEPDHFVLPTSHHARRCEMRCLRAVETGSNARCRALPGRRPMVPSGGRSPSPLPSHLGRQHRVGETCCVYSTRVREHRISGAQAAGTNRQSLGRGGPGRALAWQGTAASAPHLASFVASGSVVFSPMPRGEQRCSPRVSG
jgi:hypothetical protein